VCWCGWQTVGSARDDKSFCGVANRRDGRIMVPFSRPKRKLRIKLVGTNNPNVALLQRKCAIMFAPLIAKAKANVDRFKTSAPQRSPLVKHQLSGAAEHQSRNHEQESRPAGPKPTPGLSWDFGKISLFPPDRTEASRPVTTLTPPVMFSPSPLAMTTEPAVRPSVVPQSVYETVSAPGWPLEPLLLREMSTLFQFDFSAVRVHTDDRAAASAADIHALAYAAGPHIVFSTGQYRPAEAEGRKLIAHELTHVIQQGARPGSEGTLRLGDPLDVLERDAEEWATAFSGGAGRPSGASSGKAAGAGLIQRAGPGPGPTLTAGNAAQQQAYTQALSRIRSLDPVMHGYLSKANLNGGPATIRTNSAQGPSAQGTVTAAYDFYLDVKTAKLPPGTWARFIEGDGAMPVARGNSLIMAVSMFMEVSPSSVDGGEVFAQDLYQQGLRMLIYMDQFLPTSPHRRAAANYQNIAQAQPDYVLLSAAVEVFIDRYLKKRALKDPMFSPPPPGAAKKDADELLHGLVEEKYLRDQGKAKFHAPFSDNKLALTFIISNLDKLGLQAYSSDPDLQNIVQKAANILAAINQQTQMVAAPQPVPSSTTNPAQKTP